MRHPDPSQLLSRTEFRERALQRDNARCLSCGQPAVDVHHILNRALWPDGGFYLANAASLCAECHLKAEQTLISTEALWQAIGEEPLLPLHLTPDTIYDTHGNPMLPNGMWGMGELFWTEPVQKTLRAGGVLPLYQQRVKYPRTPKLPTSPKRDADDILVDPEELFGGRAVVASIKMDGESASVGRDYYHARSLDFGYHPTRAWMKALAARVGPELPEGWRACFENCAGTHSIPYKGLPSYALLISLWDEQNRTLSWKETVEWAELLEVPTVPVFYTGVYDGAAIQAAYEAFPPPWSDRKEGYVIRLAESFSYRDFPRSCAKYVEADFVIGNEHWTSGEVQLNGLA